MRIIYLLPMFSMSLFAHSNTNLHYHYVEYFIYLVVSIITFNILRFFLRRYV